MKTEDMTNGMRVRIVREVELFPMGRYEVGLTGTVEMSDGGDGSSAPLLRVKLDKHHPELAEWGNSLLVWGPNVPECTAEDFELV